VRSTDEQSKHQAGKMLKLLPSDGESSEGGESGCKQKNEPKVTFTTV
jgi:hypothetical protein